MCARRLPCKGHAASAQRPQRPRLTHPMVVMKLEVKLSSAKRSSRQLFPTPASGGASGRCGRERGNGSGGSAASGPGRLTAVTDQQQLDEVVIVLPLSHRCGPALAACERRLGVGWAVARRCRRWQQQGGAGRRLRPRRTCGLPRISGVCLGRLLAAGEVGRLSLLPCDQLALPAGRLKRWIDRWARELSARRATRCGGARQRSFDCVRNGPSEPSIVRGSERARWSAERGGPGSRATAGDKHAPSHLCPAAAGRCHGASVPHSGKLTVQVWHMYSCRPSPHSAMLLRSGTSLRAGAALQGLEGVRGAQAAGAQHDGLQQHQRGRVVGRHGLKCPPRDAPHRAVGVGHGREAARGTGRGQST